MPISVKQSGWVAGSLVLLLLGSGCMHYRLGPAPRPAVPLPEAFASEFRQPRTNAFSVLAWQDELSADYQLAQVKLAVPVAGATTNKTLELEYYRPQRSETVPARAHLDTTTKSARAGARPSSGAASSSSLQAPKYSSAQSPPEIAAPGDGRAPGASSALPAIVILPVSAGAHYPLERYFARYFARRGFAAVIVHRETERDPKTGDQINQLLKQSVLDNAFVLDWLQTRAEIDGARLGVLGTSMGAIKGALFVPMDNRVKAAVLGLVGGDLPYILTYSTEGALRGGGITARRKAYLAEHHLTREQFRAELERTVRYDPKLLAPSVDPNKVLLILGACDTIVPFKKGWELRGAMGKPETAVVLSGHYSAGLYLWYIRATALEFFRRKMGVTR